MLICVVADWDMAVVLVKILKLTSSQSLVELDTE
jgi:hypothetical protein